MIQLQTGNVLLKPSQRRQLMAWLRRSLRIGERLGDFVLRITLSRHGQHLHAHANVHDRAGDFSVRVRQQSIADLLRRLVRQLSDRLHVQTVQARVA